MYAGSDTDMMAKERKKKKKKQYNTKNKIKNECPFFIFFIK